MRTQEEILARIEARKAFDIFGFERTDYIGRLSFENAKEFAKEGVDRLAWEAARETLDRDAIIAAAKEYLTFAWEKANNSRGISAQRSLHHFIAWMWLAGDTAASDAVAHHLATRYEFYGKPLLARICEFYGWAWRPLDNGKWRNFEYDPPIKDIEAILATYPPLGGA